MVHVSFGYRLMEYVSFGYRLLEEVSFGYKLMCIWYLSSGFNHMESRIYLVSTL